MLYKGRAKNARFFPFLVTFLKNREFWASFVKIGFDFGVLCMHTFVVFMRKIIYRGLLSFSPTELRPQGLNSESSTVFNPRGA